ncbi:hypothetical protein PHMEG_0003160 [Phytophthora megakarya]|uniref:Uncharacterized protein n=1 Tax=Phytophthora megakarya TaxID=4795 RepID=A0A225WWX7_9STRA|nr:hypothetical protein PHMEG_0003160 [Phytophthora megakarya]
MANSTQPVSNSNVPHQPPSVLVGGYRSSSVQLEVELVERLNEIGRSNLPEKTLSRTRACQNVLDSIVLQDEPYGRLLSRIRDEFSTYVDMTCRKSPTKSYNNKESKTWCACGQDFFDKQMMAILLVAMKVYAALAVQAANLKMIIYKKEEDEEEYSQ